MFTVVARTTIGTLVALRTTTSYSRFLLALAAITTVPLLRMP